ncbi:MAG: cbb3-type cytochrome c oxidase N-terminal domain-containing protein [Polyangiaceae bacterium]
MAESEAKADAKEAPVDKDMLMGDHEYDGIQEYDNPLPMWWTLIFWGSMIFAVGYYGYYHFAGGKGVIATYDEEVAEAAKNAPAGAAMDEAALAALVADANATAEGKTVFASRCVACHGPEGGGLVGPNLTDHHWIHGEGKMTDIYKTVSEGVAAKGMPAWAKQLSQKELQNVTAYVGTLRGKMAAGKPPEGTEYKPK